MTERKPAGSTFESWIDKQVREAAERGEFENLAGAGKPIPGAGSPIDENWWLRGYLRREGVSGDVMLPTSLRLRREVERFPDGLGEFDSADEVRAACADLNARIVDWMRVPQGPMVPMGLVDVEDMLTRWSALRAPAARTVPEPPPHIAEPRERTARRGWRGWFRRGSG
ncbi:DUF1992 domain-containing protein [Nocardia takedensis]|uniref:DnaJ family domain-containing protein n=1 Tax=Nocardia takedensis TaxID=259390 RepID=UPI000309242E|nr:DUF1992 domain-containing protein [Nocardia takedensis]